MTKKYIEYTLLVCAALCSFFLVSGAWASNVGKLIKTCENCHGKGGASTESDIPIIGGYSEEFIIHNLTSYKNEERECPETQYRAGSKKGTKTNMCQVAKDLNDSDMTHIAQFFAKQKFARAKQKFDPVLARKGKEIHDMYCEMCHSEGGTVAADGTGMPAGQWIPYLKQALDEFISEKRPIPKVMKQYLDKISKADIDALINYYGSFQ
ncbi:MAG: c-type cytochrome [Betaproteobacteria bacterium]|nr:c-type cytochrome [Betaproteobacteria bacterium]